VGECVDGVEEQQEDAVEDESVVLEDELSDGEADSEAHTGQRPHRVSRTLAHLVSQRARKRSD
jgi:hypothetical protein